MYRKGRILRSGRPPLLVPGWTTMLGWPWPALRGHVRLRTRALQNLSSPVHLAFCFVGLFYGVGDTRVLTCFELIMLVAGVIVFSRSILWCADGGVCGAGTCCSTLIRGCFCAFGPTRRTGRQEGNKKDGRTQLPELDHSLSEDRWAQRLETVLKRGAIVVPESTAATGEKRQGHAEAPVWIWSRV